ncbi:unnamed protein product [Camellia sinensis]
MRSDVLGQFMPWVGVDWSQTGVAHLFSDIKENGYQLLFLSARAISQAYHTRQFLFNLKQDGKAIPDGPVVISPDGLFPSLFREVIRRAPHEFKIACLEDIRALFPPDCNPFYAGFGNRDTDEICYLKVGIPKGKIFIINSKGQVVVNHHVDSKSYTSLHTLVHYMFPPMSSSEQWRISIHGTTGNCLLLLMLEGLNKKSFIWRQVDAGWLVGSYSGILFSNHGHLRLEAFTDADWAGSIDDRRSTSGYCAFVGGNLVTWRSKKQGVVSRSSAEAEYRAMAHGTCELMWLQSLLSDIGLDWSGPMTLYCDNKAAISIAHNPVQHDRTKHIEIDRHFIKEKLNKGVICMPFVKSEDQLADVFTKGLSGKVFHSICCKLRGSVKC